jgi:CheY-like chemotaxis protein
MTFWGPPDRDDGDWIPGISRAPRRRRILIVDDNQDAASCLARLLRLNDHEVSIAHDATTAVELARGRRPEIFIVDVNLPGTSGYQIARMLRGHECGRGAVFIAVSGYARRNLKSPEFHHHLVKPLDFESLLDLIARDRSPDR